MSRLLVEREFHDAQAAARQRDLQARGLGFADAFYLDHESWIRPAFARLGDVAGRRVLDLGSGHGMAAIVLARRGALVTGLELSGGYLAESRARADANGVRIEWVQADAHFLPFPSESFDCIWGNAILHHLELPRAVAEIDRVLRPGGRAVFCEPWGDNPLLRWARRRLSYSGKGHTPDEEPLRGNCVPILRHRFPDARFDGQQLLSMVRRLGRRSGWVRALEWIDRGCLGVAPPLGRWCRYMVIELPK
jgi:SAM-dependent methyltransferase